jgi:hypothetical protein
MGMLKVDEWLLQSAGFFSQITHGELVLPNDVGEAELVPRVKF